MNFLAEFEGRAVGEGEEAVGGAIGGDSVEFRAEEADVVTFQFLVSTPQDEEADARVAEGEELGLGADGPAFAAAARPAKGDVFLRSRQKLRLSGIGARNV